jgi:hypothetical protein
VAFLALGLTFASRGPMAHAQRREREDSADRVKKLTEIAAQKLKDDVLKALADASRIGARDAARAARLLKAMLARVEDSADLTEKQHDDLVSQLKSGLKKWSQAAETAVKDRADREENKGISRFRKFTDERSRREIVDDVDKRLRSTRDSLEEGKRLRREKEAGFQGVAREVEKSSIPNGRTITFDPKVWARAAKRTSVQLTKKEMAILKILNSTISVDFKNHKFEEVIDYLIEKTGQTILLDREALKEKEIDYETPVTLKANKISVRALLRKLLNDVGLTYVIKDELIQVTTLEKAKKMQVVRTYPVADLITNGIDPRVPPLLRELAIRQNAAQLIELIKQMVEPDSWVGSESGGTGTIIFNPATLTISVKQSTEIHYKLAQFGR